MPELAHLYNKEQAGQYGNLTTFDILMTELDATNMVVNSTGESSPREKSPKSNDTPTFQMEMENSPIKGSELI